MLHVQGQTTGAERARPNFSGDPTTAPSQAAHPFTAQATDNGHINKGYATCHHQT